MIPRWCAPSASATSPDEDTARGAAGGSESGADSGLSGSAATVVQSDRGQYLSIRYSERLATASLYLPYLNADVIDRGVMVGNTGYIWRIGGLMFGVTVPLYMR